MSVINGNIMTVDEYTPEEKEKIQKLREKVLPLPKPELNEDNSLVKWLRARNFDVDKAEDMLKKHIRFARAYGLFDMKNYTAPEPILYFCTAMLGYDKEGSIVRLLNVGASDIRGICMSTSKTDCIRHASHVMLTDEEKQKKDRANDTMCDKCIYIIDLQGLSWRTIIQRIVVDRALLLLKSYEANYPERLKLVYLVNVPSFFGFILNWLKTFMPESIMSKVEILTEEEFQPRLLKCMDPEILPASLGGTRRDPNGDGNCPSLFPKPPGELVPEAFWSTDQLEALKNDPEARKVIVDYKAIFIAEKLITVPNTTITWDFQTTDYDIRMGLRYKQDENSEVEDIIPIHRVDSHIIPESGSFMCDKAGIYEMVFDNSYSWMTSKELYFKISLVLPDENMN